MDVMDALNASGELWPEPHKEGTEVTDYVRDAQLGVVIAAGNQLKGEQGPGVLLSRLEAIRDSVITGPERRVAEECIAVVKEALGC